MIAYGLGIRIEAFRILGIVFSIALVLPAIFLFDEFLTAVQHGVALYAAIGLGLSTIFLVFSYWSFRVLTGEDVRAAFKEAGAGALQDDSNA